MAADVRAKLGLVVNFIPGHCVGLTSGGRLANGEHEFPLEGQHEQLENLKQMAEHSMDGRPKHTGSSKECFFMGQYKTTSKHFEKIPLTRQ